MENSALNQQNSTLHHDDKLGYTSNDPFPAPACPPADASAGAPASLLSKADIPVFRSVNFTDWNQLMQHRSNLPTNTVRALKSIDYRIQEWPLRFGRERHQYRQNASLIAMSEFERAADFCRCCTIGSGQGKYQHGKCNVWKLCPYCSHKKRKQILSKFLPVFRRGRWWFVTISPDDLCNLNPLTIDCLVDWWESCRFALNKSIKAGLINGAFMFETLSVHAYWPHAKGLPHVHAVVLADTMTPAIVDKLTSLLASYHGQWWSPRKKRWFEPEVPEPIWAKASTRTYELLREYDFASVLSYLCNPVNLAAAYIKDWPQVAGNWRQASQFNENVVEAINAWCCALYGRWGHRYLGALQHAHRDFTGVKKANREKKRHLRMVKELLEECQLKRIVEFDPDKLGAPVEFETTAAQEQ